MPLVTGIATVQDDSQSSVRAPSRVVVLMSTYQGERFVEEQLRSILDQLPPGGLIQVRDDGSRDRTVAIVEAIGDPRIQLVRGRNLGFARSFLTLIAEAPPDADLVMLSDQDDVWLPSKIDRAWQRLQPLGSKPALYGSAQMLVDAELRPLHPTPPWPRGPSLVSALTENIITGCTAAFNRPALVLLQRAGVPHGVHLHDWWLYLVIGAFGSVLYDDEPTILYRQHGGNQIGHGAGWLARNLGFLRALWRSDWVGTLLGQVGALMRHYGDHLDSPTRQLIVGMFDVHEGRAVAPWRLILASRRQRQTMGQEVVFRVLLLLHKIHLWPPPGKRL
jgi:glycosyltransferase involved in cell wall biosynthesis